MVSPRDVVYPELLYGLGIKSSQSLESSGVQVALFAQDLGHLQFSLFALHVGFAFGHFLRSCLDFCLALQG